MKPWAGACSLGRALTGTSSRAAFNASSQQAARATERQLLVGDVPTTAWGVLFLTKSTTKYPGAVIDARPLASGAGRRLSGVQGARLRTSSPISRGRRPT